MTPDPSAALIVVNYGSHGLLERNLGELDVQGLGALVVVVDNLRSPADSRAMAELAESRGWLLVPTGWNAGFGTGVNLGAAVALARGCDVLITLNPDLEVDAAVVRELAAAVRADPASMVGPRVMTPDGRVWFGGGFVALDEGRCRSVPGPAGERTPPWLSGACLAVHRDLWSRVGGFDEEYFLYWEDVDLSYRVVRAGGRVEVRQDLTAVHQVGGTQHDPGVRARSAAYYFYNCRNRLLFAAKHLDRRDRWRWAVGTPADVRRVLLRGGRRQFARPLSCLWPGVLGSAAGLARVVRAR